MILKNCAFLVTQNKNRQIISDYDLKISEGKIIEISKKIKWCGEETIDCSKKIVMPSLINLHTHLAMSLLRGYEDDQPLNIWLNKIWGLEAKMREKDYCIGSKFGCLELIRSGTSTFLDMYFGEGENLKVVGEAKIRSYLGEVMFDFFDETKTKTALRATEKFVQNCKGQKSPLATPVVAPHSIYTCSKNLLLGAKELAKENGLLYTTHLSETRKEVYDCHKKHDKRPTEYLDSLGLIDDKFIGFHLGWITKGEASILGQKKAAAINCPVSNMKLATGGVFPYRELLAAGAKIGLGTDSVASNNSLNLLNEMKTMCLMQKWFRWNATEILAQNALDIATINGADILGLNSGSLEVGKNADILMLDKNHFSLLPHRQIVSNIVYSASRAAISDLIVNGEFVIREQKILTLNEEKTKDEFMKATQKLHAQA